VPKRRRNPDGSLVTPLSERQLANLAKGRAALAAGTGEESEPARKGEPGQRGGSRVETVRLGTKASPRKKTAARKTATSSRAKATSSEVKESGGAGLIDRAIEWFGRGE
jgi:hypothetical protein